MVNVIEVRNPDDVAATTVELLLFVDTRIVAADE
jgi:hypothetical protein